ncbi:hypothetical protein B0O80DRAFT_442707 [Mortierella sp. GBAus27b]|nr:hypothetical protein B0O80DRAFT_442707 [Mortierella sp. GBAus27b]
MLIGYVWCSTMALYTGMVSSSASFNTSLERFGVLDTSILIPGMSFFNADRSIPRCLRLEKSSSRDCRLDRSMKSPGAPTIPIEWVDGCFMMSRIGSCRLLLLRFRIPLVGPLWCFRSIRNAPILAMRRVSRSFLKSL